MTACIESWKQQCPDYAVVEWNEGNWDVQKYPYAYDAYKEGKWAFVSDVARLDIVCSQGGIYLDTDVELKNNLDSLLDYEGFLFFEFESRLATGLGFGAVQGHPFISAMLNDYRTRNFYNADGTLNLEACTYYNTDALIRFYPKIELNDQHQEYDGFALLSTGEYNRLASHHYASSWTADPKTEITEKRVWKDTRLKRFLRDSRKQMWIRTRFGYRTQKIYEFIAYDLLEAGPVYFLKRAIKKIRNKV